MLPKKVYLGKVGITVEKDYWSNTKDYDKLTIVQDEDTGNTYISRVPVPSGQLLSNRTYWILLTHGNSSTDYSGDIASLSESIQGIVERLSTVENTISTPQEQYDDTELQTKIANHTTALQQIAMAMNESTYTSDSYNSNLYIKVITESQYNTMISNHDDVVNNVVFLVVEDSTEATENIDAAESTIRDNDDDDVILT